MLSGDCSFFFGIVNDNLELISVGVDCDVGESEESKFYQMLKDETFLGNGRKLEFCMHWR